MSDNPRAERVIEWLQRSLLQVDIAEIIIHEADEPNAVVNFLDAERLTRKNRRDIDLLTVQAEAPAASPAAAPSSVLDDTKQARTGAVPG